MHSIGNDMRKQIVKGKHKGNQKVKYILYHLVSSCLLEFENMCQHMSPDPIRLEPRISSQARGPDFRSLGTAPEFIRSVRSATFSCLQMPILSLIILSLFGTIWHYLALFVTLCHYLSLFVTICHYLSLFVTLCHSLSLFATICHYLSVFVTICHYLALFVTICHSLSLFVNLCHYLSLFVTIVIQLHAAQIDTNWWEMEVRWGNSALERGLNPSYFHS